MPPKSAAAINVRPIASRILFWAKGLNCQLRICFAYKINFFTGEFYMKGNLDKVMPSQKVVMKNPFHRESFPPNGGEDSFDAKL